MSETQPDLIKQPTDLEIAFEKFDQKNPFVWEMFCVYANEAVRLGVQRIGVALIIERIRWQTITRTTGSAFKIPNAHRAYYARKWKREFPQHASLFQTARVKGEKSNE